MNKRDFLKFLGMAPVAAPVVMSSINEGTMKYGNVGAPATRAFGLQSLVDNVYKPDKDWNVDKPDKDWLMKRLKEHQQNLLDINDINVQDEDDYTEAYVSSLKSVSKAAKIIIRDRLRTERARRSQRSWLESEIENLKEKLGLLGMVL